MSTQIFVTRLFDTLKTTKISYTQRSLFNISDEALLWKTVLLTIFAKSSTIYDAMYLRIDQVKFKEDSL